MQALQASVERLMREVAATSILPRFQRLAVSDVEEKSPGEIVTVADRESEARLTEGLLALLPDARVLGEEASAADPTSVGDLSSGLLWIVDPLDGTSNFAAGRGPFAIMVALAIDGEPEAAWILDPMSGRISIAVRGRGAKIDGLDVRARSTGASLPIVAVALHRLAPERREEIAHKADGKLNIMPMPLCAGDQYPALVLGKNDASVYVRALPWDHVPGSLFLKEAGGAIARPDGSPYRLDRPGPGLIAASSYASWEKTAEVLFR